MRFLIGRQNMRVATLVLFIAASAVAEEWKLGTTQLQGSAGINIAEDRAPESSFHSVAAWPLAWGLGLRWRGVTATTVLSR